MTPSPALGRSRKRQPLRFAVLGAGFWSFYQLSGWRELGGAVECAAIYNRTLSRAKKLAAQFGVAATYSDPEQLLRSERLDFVDIITGVDAHVPLVELAAAHGIPVICQKPMAPSLALARRAVSRCRRAGVPFLIHENWRWQRPIRELKTMLDSGRIGRPFRARIDMISGFKAWQNQPALKDLEQFILADLGSHLLDAARFLFGEARSVYCETQRTLPFLRGENVATAVLNCSETTVLCEMAYAETPLEREIFPETLIFIEGTAGSLELLPDYRINVTTAKGTATRRYPPRHYRWANPDYDVVHASIVDCNRDLLRSLRGEGQSETTAEDNLKTMKLVFSCYESAAKKKVISLPC